MNDERRMIAGEWWMVSDEYEDDDDDDDDDYIDNDDNDDNDDDDDDDDGWSWFGWFVYPHAAQSYAARGWWTSLYVRVWLAALSLSLCLGLWRCWRWEPGSRSPAFAKVIFEQLDVKL